MQKTLSDSLDLGIKFSDIDSLGIVWHGHYVRYFEEGREAFGRKYDLGYTVFKNNGYHAPIVKVSCDYKRMIRYEDDVKLVTTLVDTAAAKLVFKYKLIDNATKKIIATGTSTQVFVDKDSFEMQLTLPQFIKDWKKKWLKG